MGKLIVAKGFKNLHKVQKIAQSGHTGPARSVSDFMSCKSFSNFFASSLRWNIVFIHCVDVNFLWKKVCCWSNSRIEGSSVVRGRFKKLTRLSYEGIQILLLNILLLLYCCFYIKMLYRVKQRVLFYGHHRNRRCSFTYVQNFVIE